MRWITVTGLTLAWLAAPGAAGAQWSGLVDQSTALGTDRFAFFGSNPEAGGNENYYDGDLGDFDGDGLADRLLGARYGILFNTGGGVMEPVRRDIGHLLRGDPGASGWGEDAMALIDVDGDGDLDALSGGNGEPLSCQINNQWRWRVLWSEAGHSALNIVPTDLEGDGDVDLLVAHSFCIERSCGGPVDFDVMVNDGTGNFTEEAAARGLALAAGQQVVGVVSGDVDNDGDFDIITQRGDASSYGIQVAFNDGTGMFTTSFSTFPVGCSGFGQNMSLGDIDDDGDLDIVAGRCIGEGMSSVYAGPYPGGHPTISHVIGINDGTGSFTDESAARFDADGFPDELAGNNASLVDIDYDGDLDLLAVRKAASSLMLDTHHLQVFLNDGAGSFRYSSMHSHIFPGRGSGLGADVDISDLDGDGDYDVWAGFGSDVVHIFMNDYFERSGVPVDQPRNARVVSADSAGVTLAWDHARFASSARRYHVYRSLADRVEGRDRELIGIVGRSAHLDQDFFGTVDRHTTTAQLSDPNAAVDPTEIRYTDRTATPGVAYFYTVTHVGPEHTESSHTPELFARVPGTGVDVAAPELSIVSPTPETWDAFPRIVITFGDDGAIDPTSVDVSFDVPVGGSPAGTNLASMLAYRSDADAFIAYLEPPFELPADTPVTLTARVADLMGNRRTEQVSFFVNTLPAIRSSPMPPTASFIATPMDGRAPLYVLFDGSTSADPDGPIMRWEWYFGDGETDIGRVVTHEFAAGGSYDVTLVVRDSEGRVGVRQQTFAFTGRPPGDAGMPGADAGSDGGACIPACGTRSCGDDGCGGQCGICLSDQSCDEGLGRCRCASGEVACGSACGIDLLNDRRHCGGCDRACAVGEACNGGACEMSAGTPSGCGCRVPGRGPAQGPVGLGLLLLLGLLARRAR